MLPTQLFNEAYSNKHTEKINIFKKNITLSNFCFNKDKFLNIKLESIYITMFEKELESITFNCLEGILSSAQWGSQLRKDSELCCFPNSPLPKDGICL